MLRPTTFIALSALLLTSCSDHSEVADAQSTLTQPSLPAKPSGKPCYLNTSTLQTINEVAIGDLKRAEEHTNIDYSMALLDGLPDGYTPETAAAELFDQWQIGHQHNGRGVLFLFIEAEGILKIEVGYEVEDIFTDGFVASFQETLKDYYRGEYFGDVVSSMIITMMRRAQGEDAQAMMTQFQGGLPKISAPSVVQRSDYLSGGAGVTESNFIKSRTDRLHKVKQLSDKERAHYSKDADVETVLKRYLDSLKKGINDPYLPLLTKGSQFMRMEYPKNSGFQKSAYRNFSGSYTIHKSGDYAAARFDRPEVMPILFRKDAEGDWLADITKSWAYSQATRDLKLMKPAYGDNAWIFAWDSKFKEPEIPATPAPLPKDQSLEEAITQLEKAIKETPTNASNYFKLADIFFYECYWIRDAMKLIEQGLEYESENCLYRKRYVNFAYRFPDLSKVRDQYEAIYKHNPGDFLNLGSYRSYLKRNRPTGYEAKREELQRAKDNKPLPSFPFPLYTKSGKYERYSFYFKEETRSLKADYRFFAAQWHDTYTPATKIYIYDENSKAEFGVMLIQEIVDGPITVHPLASEKHKFIPTTIPNSESIELNINWESKNLLKLTINDNEVLTMPSEMKPQRVITYQRSGSSILNLKEGL